VVILIDEQSVWLYVALTVPLVVPRQWVVFIFVGERLACCQQIDDFAKLGEVEIPFLGKPYIFFEGVGDLYLIFHARISWNSSWASLYDL